MNKYSLKFFAYCPENNLRIEYDLQIMLKTKIMAEDLIDAVNLIDRGHHEEIANQLHREFGGLQTLKAYHHGVNIETIREDK